MKAKRPIHPEKLARKKARAAREARIARCLGWNGCGVFGTGAKQVPQRAA